MNSKIKKFGKVLDLSNFSIKTTNENSKPGLSLRTDFVDADISGYYNFAALGELVKSTLATLMPSQFPKIVSRQGSKKNNFTFNINIKKTDDLSNFFRTGIHISENSNINGAVSS